MKKPVTTNLNLDTLNDDLLESILTNSGIQQLYYIKRPENDDIWSDLNKKIFKFRKDISLRIDGSFRRRGTWKDLSFLEELDEVELLIIQDFEIKLIEPITSIKNLISLELDINPDASLKPLEKFKNLEVLKLTGLEKDAEVISNFTKLKELHLTATPTTSDFKFLKPLSELKELYFYQTYNLSTNSFDILPEIGKIETLLFTQIEELHNIDFVSKMPHLKHLELWALPIKALPQFPKTSPLEKVTISDLDDLEDIMGLCNLQSFKLFESLDATEQVYKLLELQISQLEKIMNRELTY